MTNAEPEPMTEEKWAALECPQCNEFLRELIPALLSYHKKAEEIQQAAVEVLQAISLSEIMKSRERLYAALGVNR